jgi:Cu(I)/Ag(I) efflux system protein CusF
MNRMMTTLLALVVTVSTATAAQPYKGQIVKVDGATGKIMIKHGPIKKFDMEAMSMGYGVSDTSILKGFKAGDKITFDADQTDGKFVVTKIEKSK